MPDIDELIGARFEDTVRNKEYEIVDAEESFRGARIDTEAVDGPDFVDSHSVDTLMENVESGRWSLLDD